MLSFERTQLNELQYTPVSANRRYHGSTIRALLRFLVYVTTPQGFKGVPDSRFVHFISFVHLNVTVQSRCGVKMTARKKNDRILVDIMITIRSHIYHINNMGSVLLDSACLAERLVRASFATKRGASVATSQRPFASLWCYQQKMHVRNWSHIVPAQGIQFTLPHCMVAENKGRHKQACTVPDGYNTSRKSRHKNYTVVRNIVRCSTLDEFYPEIKANHSHRSTYRKATLLRTTRMGTFHSTTLFTWSTLLWGVTRSAARMSTKQGARTYLFADMLSVAGSTTRKR